MMPITAIVKKELSLLAASRIILVTTVLLIRLEMLGSGLKVSQPLRVEVGVGAHLLITNPRLVLAIKEVLETTFSITILDFELQVWLQSAMASQQ